jgi:hypothetical protein
MEVLVEMLFLCLLGESKTSVVLIDGKGLRSPSVEHLVS